LYRRSKTRAADLNRRRGSVIIGTQIRGFGEIKFGKRGLNLVGGVDAEWGGVENGDLENPTGRFKRAEPRLWPRRREKRGPRMTARGQDQKNKRRTRRSCVGRKRKEAFN